MIPSMELMVWGTDLVDKYVSEAKSLLEACWQEHKGFEGYGFFESILTFAIVREEKPDVIFEISPACGMSTYPLALAVAQNGKGQIYSFEINEEYVRQQFINLRRWGLHEYVEPIQGDVKKQIDDVLKKVVFTDILFMDSDHGEEMGKWYLEKLWPQTTKWMHVHDFYYLPQDGEIVAVRNFLQTHPEIKWLSSKHLTQPGITWVERHGEANSSIWVQKPPMRDIVKKWRALGAMMQ